MGSQVFNNPKALTLTQLFILPRSKWVPGTPGELVVKSKNCLILETKLHHHSISILICKLGKKIEKKNYEKHVFVELRNTFQSVQNHQKVLMTIWRKNKKYINKLLFKWKHAQNCNLLKIDKNIMLSMKVEICVVVPLS